MLSDGDGDGDGDGDSDSDSALPGGQAWQVSGLPPL